MDREKPPLNPKLRDLADRERRNLGPHPTPEQLADYHAGKLSSEDEEAIRDHLALCPECAELFLDLVDFASPEPTRDISGLTDEEVDAAWQEMRARLSGTPAAGKPPDSPEARAPRAVPEPVPEPPPEPRAETPAVPSAGSVVPLQRPERARPSRVYQSLAAMFLLTTLGAGFWAVSLQRQLQEPQVGAVEITLEPQERSSDEIPSTRDLLNVSISRYDLPESETFRVEVLADGEEDILWTREMVIREERPLRVNFPPGFLKPGRYRLRIVGLDGEGTGSSTDFSLLIGQ